MTTVTVVTVVVQQQQLLLVRGYSSCDGVSDLVLSIRLLFCYSGGNSLFVVGGQVSSCGGGLLSNCIGQRFSTVVAMHVRALLQMWCIGTCLIMASCMSLIVPWLMLSCSDVCLCFSLVLAWCSSLVVLRSYLICHEHSS